MASAFGRRMFALRTGFAVAYSTLTPKGSALKIPNAENPSAFAEGFLKVLVKYSYFAAAAESAGAATSTFAAAALSTATATVESAATAAALSATTGAAVSAAGATTFSTAAGAAGAASAALGTGVPKKFILARRIIITQEITRPPRPITIPVFAIPLVSV